MKTLLKFFVFASIIILIAIGCQKILSNEDLIAPGEPFNTAVVKNWYYGTFVKTTEWSDAAEKDKQLPDWKNGVTTIIDKQEAVVYPFIKGQHAFLLPGDKSLTKPQCKRIADASLSKIAFIKTAANQITVREIDYIPDWQYLQNKKFNIGEMKGVNGKSDFSGRIITKDWAGKILSIQIQVDGKTVRFGKKIKNKNSAKSDNNTSSLEGCTYTTLCLWQQDCVITIYGDGMITDECGEWYIVECWEEENCPDPPPGGGGGGGPIDPPPVCDLTGEQADDALNSITSQFITTQSFQRDLESDPDPNGVIRMPVTPKGMGLSLHMWGAYTPVWNTKYIGVLFKTTTNATWKWESFSFNTVSQTSGTMAPCFDAEASTNISTAISGDKITALAAGDYAVTIKCTCLAGIRIGSPNNVQLDHHDEFNATTAATQ